MKIFIVVSSLIIAWSSVLAQKSIELNDESLDMIFYENKDVKSVWIQGENPPFTNNAISLFSANKLRSYSTVNDFDGGYMYLTDAQGRITLELYGDRLPEDTITKNNGHIFLRGDSPIRVFPFPESGPFVPFHRMENDFHNQTWEIGIQGHPRGDIFETFGQTELVFRYDFGEVANIDENGVYHTVSDQKFKQDIEKLPSVLSNLMQIQPSSYLMKRNPNGNKCFGFIAQDVKHHFPELVREKQEGDEPYMMLNYAGIIPITVKAIQEQQEMILEQQEALNAQADKIEMLLERIKALEKK